MPFYSFMLMTVKLSNKIIGCHFRTIPVNEKDTLTYFIYSVKNDKNKSDLKLDSGVH
ncbi:hypothetical protein JD844_026954 [Phrynosoma platyrhinos]|uniref:Histone deacetylase complex subunit SAP30 Sin3 binding domain-containing protein n=1 Tax=Phrynosoma platyrhinos TaxID=52577 RepID=A0ABQ7SFJ5_PHRPL|nr:hypothetical protein JD844_026954 [Phrynosoma platyrhinos]